MKIATFIKLTGIIGIATLAEKALTLAFGILLARWLGPSGYGTYAFAMAVVGLLVVLVRFGLPSLILREISALGADPQRGTPGVWIWRSAALVGAFGVLVALVAILFARLGRSGEDAVWFATLMLGLWLLPVMGVSDVFLSSLRAMGKQLTANLVGQLFPAGLIVLLIAVLIFGIGAAPSPSLAMAARLLVSVLVVATLLAMVRRLAPRGTETRPTSSQSYAKLMRLGWPFLLINGSTVLLSRSDTIVLGTLTEPTTVGIYNVALQGAVLVLLVVQIAETLSGPEYARLIAAGETERLGRFARTTARLVFGGAITVALVLAIFGGALIDTLFGDAYAAGHAPLILLAIGFALTFSLGSPTLILSMAGKEKVALRLVLVAVVANIALNFVLIPPLGMMGAAVATVVSSLIWRLPCCFIVRRTFGFSPAII